VNGFMYSPVRFINVSWDVEHPSVFPVEVQVEAFDRTKLLRDISSAVSDAGVNILSASVTTSRNRVAIFKFVFEVSSPSHLESILNNIKAVNSVLDAYRISPVQK
ncbi:MAG: ACT domain-containing protein, partial [Candidatus Subteraquimicrobiales bacterium]|nr:ACT domain-containing protein [Candidatus Subteraquimicrobiales bacterium]